MDGSLRKNKQECSFASYELEVGNLAQDTISSSGYEFTTLVTDLLTVIQMMPKAEGTTFDGLPEVLSKIILDKFSLACETHVSPYRNDVKDSKKSGKEQVEQNFPQLRYKAIAETKSNDSPVQQTKQA